MRRFFLILIGLIISNYVLSNFYDDTLNDNNGFIFSFKLKKKDSLNYFFLIHDSNNDSISVGYRCLDSVYDTNFSEKDFQDFCVKSNSTSLLKLYFFIKSRRKTLFLFHQTRGYLSWGNDDLKQKNLYLIDVVINDLKTKYVDLISDNYEINTFQYLFVNYPWKIISSLRLYFLNKKATLEIYENNFFSHIQPNQNSKSKVKVTVLD